MIDTGEEYTVENRGDSNVKVVYAEEVVNEILRRVKLKARI